MVEAEAVVLVNDAAAVPYVEEAAAYVVEAAAVSYVEEAAAVVSVWAATLAILRAARRAARTENLFCIFATRGSRLCYLAVREREKERRFKRSMSVVLLQFRARSQHRDGFAKKGANRREGD